MNQVIVIFVGIVILFLVISLILIWISTYPPNFIVKKFYKNPLHDIKKYYFYYNKATAYRLLFTNFNIFGSIMQVLTIASTFITVYIAANDSKYVVLASLISATCEVVKLMLQPEKYAKAFSDAALIMEFSLLDASEESEKNLLAAYKTAENKISKTK